MNNSERAGDFRKSLPDRTAAAGPTDTAALRPGCEFALPRAPFPVCLGKLKLELQPDGSGETTAASLTFTRWRIPLRA